MIQVNYQLGHQDINGYWNSYPNSSGGVSVKFSIKNVGTKTIKYAGLFFIPYNNVGDQVGCTVRNESERGVKIVGPIGPNGYMSNRLFENAWWNNSIRSIELSKAIVEYTDGTEETIQGYQISQIQAASGCYIATAVYGSYDCPQVWTLRRYRDYTLAKTWYGRAFIRTYYAISPTLVKWFGHTEWFKKMWQGTLERMVEKLQFKGVESTPYEDRNW